LFMKLFSKKATSMVKLSCAKQGLSVHRFVWSELVESAHYIIF
jgi:hypothetical protein